jgi:hypothetical protein
MVRRMSDFNIFLDADNELAFAIEIDGAESSSVRSQFVIEGTRGINLSFAGESSGGDVTVEVPSLKGLIKEGVYNTRLEVIIDDRIFIPLEMKAAIKPSIKVEAVIKTSRKITTPVVTASVLSSKKNKKTVLEKKRQPKPTTRTRAAVDNSSTEIDKLLKDLESLR